ncbi:serine/threonine-protein kinase pim-2-like [Ctenopharyngodon idella]|uniref:serine/threonine-protein kinase pim-2-like n=1 Tax=Ctenopharyngodon idella TaxID=7959 RepID=UPI00222FFEE5|nr:serine/threonine-protein kinase pim-2-like [Ctenopharyngodon idella]
MSPTPVPERLEKKRGRLFRWAFSRKSKKTPIEAQQVQCRNGSSQPPQRCSDGEDEHKNNTQSINTPSNNNVVHSLNKAEESSDTNTSVYSCVSSFSAVEKVNEDVPKAEENSNTSVYSWHSCVSTLNTVQEADAPRQEQEDINVNNGTFPTVSSITEGDLSAPLLSDDIFWKTEDEIINISSNAKRGDIYQDYKIGRLLGQGGFGKVYEGTRLSDSRKGLFGKSLPNEIAMMIQVSKGPSVPQIIKLLDWYETRKEYILVIERPTPCKDLRKYLVQNDGRISESKARAVMHQVVTAARICFERGIFHSDIKLENLLINENSLQVKLIDFGVSRSLKKSGYTRYIGTRIYAPPEAFHKTCRYHAKPATVYSLGILLYLMLFGKYPYIMEPKIFARTLKTAEISKECKELISLCMEKDPAKRIDLDKILDHDWFQVLLLKPESQNEEPRVSEFKRMDSFLRKYNLCVL